MTDSVSSVSLRRIFIFWLPLAATWLMMSVEGPFLAAVIARLPDPKFNLAAYGVAYALALIVEAPVIMIMSAATALVRDRQSYLAMRRFTHGLNAAITLIMLLILVPPVFNAIAGGLIGLPEDVLRRTYLATLMLLPWPGAIGIRRFYQGVLIRSGMTRRVAYGTIVRLATMVATAVVLHRISSLEGASIGAAALSVGVLVEAVVAWFMARRSVLTVMATPGDGEPLSFPSIVSFYYPLALTTLLSLGLHPIVTFFMGHSRAPLDSLAVLPVVMSLVFVFRALGLAYQEVGIALIGDGFENYLPLRRFATLLGVAVVVGLGIIAWTPLANLWFHNVSGLSSEFSRFAILPTRLLVIIPGLTVLLSFQRSMLVNYRATSHVTWATAIEVTGAIGILALMIFGFGAVGAVAAACALVIGRIGANLYLVPPLRRLRRAGQTAEGITDY